MFSQIEQIFSHIIRTRLAASLILMLSLSIAAGAQEVTITSSPTSIMEGKRATFIISVTPAPTSNLTVNIEVTGNTIPTSYTRPTRITVGTSGQYTLRVPTEDFTENPNDENWGDVSVRIIEGDGYTIGEQGSASVQVIDDEADENPPATVAPLPVVTLHTDQTRVAIGDRVTLTMKRTTPYDKRHRVDFRVAGHLPDITDWEPMVEILHPQSANRHPPGERSYSFRVQEETCGHTPGRKIEAYLFDAYYYGDNIPQAERTGDSAYKVGDPSSVTIGVYAPPNWQPTGAPTISGNLDVDQTLTVSHGLSGVTNIQWIRVQGSTETNIGTADTYTIVSADSGHRLKVKVTFNDGTCEIESALTAVVGGGMPVGTIDTNPPTIIEGQTKTFRITFDPAPTAPLNAEVHISQIGDFITGSPGVGTHTVNFSANQATATITVRTEDDQVDEPNGEISAELLKRTGYDVGDPSIATVIVEDNDEESPPPPPTPSVSISASPTTITEGGATTVTVTASPAPTNTITVNVNVSQNGTFISGSPPSSVTINANQTTATFTINTVNDNIDEPNGSITAQVQGGTGYTVGAPSSVTITVNDNDTSPPGTPSVTITAGTSPITEGTSATFTLTASPAPTTSINVSVNVTQNGNFISGSPGTRTVSIGTSGTATLTVATNNDNTDEPNGSITAQVQGGAGYTVGSPSSATVNINDNDTGSPPPETPSVTISAGTSPVTEGTNATFTLTASPAPTTSINVSVNVSQTGNFISASPPSTITIGTSGTATLTVATNNDNIDEPNGSITAQVQGGTGYTVGSPSSATVNVNDNDTSPPGTPSVSISANPTTITEGGTTTVTVTASTAPSTAINVSVNVTQNGNFISGSPPSSVTINANQTTATFTINTVNDNTDEPNGSITTQVQAGTGYTVGSPSSATVTVNDNDVSGGGGQPIGVTPPPQPPPQQPPQPPQQPPQPPPQPPPQQPTPPTPSVTISAGTSPITEGTDATFTLTANPAPTTSLNVMVNVSQTGNFISGSPGMRLVTISTSGTATLTVETDNDNTDEPNGSITAQVKAGAGYTVGSPSSATVTVNDNDAAPRGPPQPKVTITANPTTITEGTDATFTLTANPRPTAALKVRVNVTQTGSVISGTPPSTVTFRANQTTATLTIATHDDNVDEVASQVTAQIQAGTGYTVGSPSSATVTVNDNDIPQMTITANRASVTEGTAATFTITANPRPATALTVNVNVTQTGEVISGTPPSTVTFPANQTTATLRVATDDDDVRESAGTVTAQITAGVGYTVGTPSSASVTVNDNDRPPNSPATGAPIIIGKPELGETLTTDVSNIRDANGLTNVSYNYQWIRVMGNVEMEIPGATGSTYTVVTADSGYRLKVRVNFTDDAGYPEELESALTAMVVIPGVTPVITITAVPPSVTEGEAATFTITANPAPTTAITINVNITQTGDVISGTPPATVTISANDSTATLTVATDDDNTDEEASTITAQLQAGTGYTVGTPSSATVNVNDNDLPPNSPATGAPTISGTPEVGETLIADISNIRDANGLENVIYTYQWFRVTGNVQIKIFNATGAMYEVVTADIGHQLKVRVNFNDDAGYAEELESELTVAVVAPVVPQLTITADNASITEGEAATFTITANPAPTTAITVNVNITQTGDVISGTPPSTITISANDSTATLTVATDDDNVDEEAGTITAQLQTGTGYTAGDPSSATVTVNDNDLPPNSPATGAPTITGTPEVGETLTADVSNIRDADGLENVTYIYQWIRVMGGVATEIPNATGVTYEVAAADIGSQIKVRVNFNDDLGNAEELESELTSVVVAPAVPQLTITADNTSITEGEAATFTITATPAPTAELTVNVSVTQTGDVISGTPPSTITINANETSATLTVATDDDNVDEEASIITAQLQTGTGYTVGDPSSATVTVNDNDLPPNRPATGAPTITGTPEVGETLTADVSNIRDADGLENVTYIYQWIRVMGGVATEIPNATGVTYEVAAADIGSQIKVRVNFNDDLGNAEELESELTSVVVAPVVPQVTISANTTSITEGEAATFTITANPAPTTAITVNVNITQTGDVISGTPPATITINANQTTLTVATDDDNVDEEASAITAQVQAGTGYTVGDSSSASVTVNDNDLPPNSPATGAPTIIGTPEVGETLTADVSNIQDANGLTNVSYTYQWIRLVGSVETEIIGATGVTYEVTITDTDRQLKVRVNFADDLGYDEELESAWTAIITPEEPRVVKLDGWLARFGRTASNHVVETVRERVRGHVGTNHVVIGGYNLHKMNTNGLFFNPTLMPGDSPMRFSIEAAQSDQNKEILKQIISSTSFALSGTMGPYSEPRWAVWGRGATTRFSGTDADQTVEGDVTSVMLGIDYGDNSFQGGLVLSYSMGDGVLGTLANTRDEWSVETTLTGIYPWARLALTNKFSVWGMLGYGGGDLPLSLEDIVKLETDASMVMGAIGTRTDLIGSTYHDGFTLTLASDAVLSRANADDLRDLLENKGTASRVRVLLEGSHVLWVAGGSLQPLAELGMRYDGGDADTGMGIEIGAGMRYVLTSLGLMIEGRVRGLIAHQEGSYEEWGGSGTIRLSPNPSGEGLSLRVSPSWGDASGSARVLWSMPDMSDIASGRNSEVFASNRVSAEVAYGVPVLGDKLIATPFVGLQNRHKRLGVGLHRGSLFGLAVEGMQHNQDLALRVRAGMHTQHIILRLEGSLDTYGHHAYFRLHHNMN